MGESVAWANAPAPWAICRGKREGERCDSRYYPRGLCVRDPEARCADDERSGGVCLSCEAGADRSFARDVTPAAAALVGAAGIALAALARRKRGARS
ncbi:MAG TPA: hypothetical protein VFF06_22970 [Polyangia bacterium]|nr:hypothetical protein [Polyangia bacterium]